eukprot:CAMPEP_0171324720 /NCGR_PEP_ID=MMETSP0816-20121228/116366_1 /TAXON_ID=420281 /ORGANISM="Proboscia inermis, Strain CCAP1064/1" /LENGTH=46 /DNA_ID= /DNA_START= /DNA_END= /DNA_ORIENTATION=
MNLSSSTHAKNITRHTGNEFFSAYMKQAHNQAGSMMLGKIHKTEAT